MTRQCLVRLVVMILLLAAWCGLVIAAILHGWVSP